MSPGAPRVFRSLGVHKGRSPYRQLGTLPDLANWAIQLALRSNTALVPSPRARPLYFWGGRPGAPRGKPGGPQGALGTPSLAFPWVPLALPGCLWPPTKRYRKNSIFFS